jgi:hypothetical protein
MRHDGDNSLVYQEVFRRSGLIGSIAMYQMKKRNVCLPRRVCVCLSQPHPRSMISISLSVFFQFSGVLLGL